MNTQPHKDISTHRGTDLADSYFGSGRAKLAATLSLGALLVGVLTAGRTQQPQTAPRQGGQTLQKGTTSDLNAEGIRWLDRHLLGRSVKKGNAPRVGQISYGGYLPEALTSNPNGLLSSPSLASFHQVKHEAHSFSDFHYVMMNNGGTIVFNDVCRYPFYRRAVDLCYGVPLADATYFSVSGRPNRRVAFARAYELGAWILEAAPYGEPMVGLEFAHPFYRIPAEKDKIPWQVFAKQANGDLHPEMEALKCMALELQKRQITFKVRFLSEANLTSSSYSAVQNPKLFTESARLFLREMPKNVKVVFSPAIGASRASIERLCRDTQGILPFHIIGGTLFSRPQQSLSDLYAPYYQAMCDLYRKDGRKTPFQICELGAPVSQQQDVLAFLTSAEGGKYPVLRAINLFGGPLRHTNSLGEYGFVDGTRSKKSYLTEHLKVSR